MIRRIRLTQGKYAVIDAKDLDKISELKWCAVLLSGRWYASSRVRWVNGKRRQRIIFMHRLIADAPEGIDVDHRDGNGLNNRRKNLRFATTQQNAWNRGKAANNTSGHRGVCFSRKAGKWQAQIHVKNSTIWLGYFDSKIQAAHAFDNKIRELHGEFACPNFKNQKGVADARKWHWKSRNQTVSK